MKKNLLAFSLTLSFTTVSTFAATSANLLIKGTVPSVVSIAVVAETIATSLPLDLTQSNTRVAKVTEKTNAVNGYKVTVESVNKGKLLRSGGTEQFGYNLAYNGQALNLITPAPINYSSSVKGEQVRDVNISYTGIPSESMVAGDYVDTVTFSIAAN